jgi:lipopolysaccharide export system permease protein
VNNLSLSRILLPGISVMDRYIITQLLMPFLFGVGAFSSIVLAVGSLFDLVRQVAEAGLPITIAIEIISPFLAGWLPNFIGLAIGCWLVAQAAK